MVSSPDGIWVRSPVDGLFDGVYADERPERWHWTIVDPATNEPSEPFTFDAPLALVTPDLLWAAGYDEQDRGRVSSYDRRTFELVSRSEPIESLFHQAVIDPMSRTVWFSAIHSIYRVDIE
jgi:hypothetical protein